MRRCRISRKFHPNPFVKSRVIIDPKLPCGKHGLQCCIFQLAIHFIPFPSYSPIVRWSPFSQLLHESRDVEGPKHFDAALGRGRCHGLDGGVVQGGIGTEPGYAKGLRHVVACPQSDMPHNLESGTQQNT